MSDAAAAAPPGPRVGRLAVGSWVLYDLANTIFSLNIVSLYFALWIVRDMGGRDADYGFASAISQVFVFVSAPFLGALSDQMPRRVPLLAISTAVCCLATVFLGAWGPAIGLILFIVANYAYQAGLVFYDALLPDVSNDANRGRISGLGSGIGYLGSFVGLGVGMLILTSDPQGKPTVFLWTGSLFALFSIPCFLFVRERVRGAGQSIVEAALRAIRELRDTLARVRSYPGLGRFLIGRALYADATTTIIVFMGVYVTQELGFTERGAELVLAVGIAAAIVAGLVWGWVVDAIGARRTLNLVLGVWAIVFVGAAAVAYLRLPTYLFWIIAPLAGVGLAGTSTADRPLLLQLAPRDRIGQFYGLYAMIGRFAAIVGPALWGFIVDILGLGRPAAVLSLLAMVVLSYVVLRPLRSILEPTR